MADGSDGATLPNAGCFAVTGASKVSPGRPKSTFTFSAHVGAAKKSRQR